MMAKTTKQASEELDEFGLPVTKEEAVKEKDVSSNLTAETDPFLRDLYEDRYGGLKV